MVQHSFAATHSGGVLEEDCTFDFYSLSLVIQKVEYLFDHYQSTPSGYEYQGPHLPYSEVHIIVGHTPLPIIVKSLRFKHSEGSHRHVLVNDLGNLLMQKTFSTTQVVRCFFIVYPMVCIIKLLHAVLENAVPALICSLPTMLMNLHFIANTQRQAEVVGAYGQIVNCFPWDSDQQNSDLISDIICSMESMALVVKQYSAWLTPDNPVSAELHAWIGAAGPISLIMALNQASANQQACESAHSMVSPASGIGVEESGDSGSTAQGSDSEPQSDLSADIHHKKQKHHCCKAKKSKSKRSKKH